MKKDKLIKLLEALPGNPDIVLWNGMVGDWMDVAPALVEASLVKMSFEAYVRHVEFEHKRDRNDFDFKLSPEQIEELKKSYRKHYQWECNEFVTAKDVKNGTYTKKRVWYINAKRRGVSTWDRLGDIEY